MAKMKDGQVVVSGVGEWYLDMLAIDAWINSRSIGAQASGLLCTKVQEREARIKERLAYLAEKRKISVKELTNQILTGQAVRLMPHEVVLEDTEQADSE